MREPTSQQLLIGPNDFLFRSVTITKPTLDPPVTSLGSKILLVHNTAIGETFLLGPRWREWQLTNIKIIPSIFNEVHS